VDHYLHRVDELERVKTLEMGLPYMCNNSCYYGCLHRLLFQESEQLVNAAKSILKGRTNYIAVQVRMGGHWATGMRIKEPFRTYPTAVPHFFSMIEEIRRGDHLQAARVHPDWFVNSARVFLDAPLFVSSDSSRFINETVARFGAPNVFFVPGDAFQHTDTLNLGEVKPEKYKKLDRDAVERHYFLTLLNHYMVSEGQHVVMAQSGFGDTAFWRGRRTASCIFMDMTNNRYAWQHHLSYPARGSGAVAMRSRVLDTTTQPTPFY
jgi:hypothetical protein